MTYVQGVSGVCVLVCILESMSQKAGWVICDLVEAIIATRVKCILGSVVKQRGVLVEKMPTGEGKKEAHICTHAHKFIERACV